MRHVWQSNTTNPAIFRESGGVFALPGISNSLFFDGPTYNQLVTQRNGKPVINIDQVIEYLGPTNVIRDDLTLETFGFAVPIKNKAYFSFGHSIRYHAYFKYPKELPQVVYQGNAQFVGETVDLSNEVQVTGYHQLGFGLGYKFGEFTLGAKAKFLSGIADASTNPDHNFVSLYTDPDVYQLTLQGDYILNTANSLDYESYDDLEADFGFGTFTTNYFFDGNVGWAFDLGARWQADGIDIAVSILDIGDITWKRDVTNYTATKTYEYDGLDFSAALTGGESPDLESALDTLEAIFEVEELENEYTTEIPTKVYMSLLYDLSEKYTVGGSIFYEKFRSDAKTVVAFGGNGDLTKWLNVGLTYAISEESFDNLGLNLTLQSKTFQVFAVTDNVIALLNSGESRAFGARVGANLHF